MPRRWGCGHGEEWSRLGSNQRPPACEAGALPLSYETGAERRTRTKISTHRANAVKEFVRSRSGGLSSCFAPGDDLVRCARM